MLYIIETEDCGNTPAVLAIVNKHFDCYKVERGGIGYWDGKPEPTLTLKFDNIGDSNRFEFQNLVDNVAYAIKALNKQDNVLVEEIPSTSKLI